MFIQRQPIFDAANMNDNIIEQAKQELLAIHANDRRAHFATDADALLAYHPDTFINVRDGAIRRMPRETIRESFKSYFENAEYHEWDDLEPPIVRIADDASIAWMIVRTRVRRKKTDASGIAQDEEFVYAGIMTYEHQDGRWVRTANVSTFEPRT